MTEIVIGEYEGEPIVYQTTEVDSVILATLTKLLVSTFVSFGLKALLNLIKSDEFKVSYPGGNLKMIYKLIKHATDDPNHTKCDLSLALDNLITD